NLRMVAEHPNAEIVGICDEDRSRMMTAAKNFSLPDSRIYTDYRKCIEETKPDLVILCPPTSQHAEWVERVAPYGVNVLLEKPFAASLAEADRIIAAMKDRYLAVNWPLAWYPPHVTAKRLIDEGRIGKVIEVHFYDGNRGPLWHLADKVETTQEIVNAEKPNSWFYKKSQGGGSLLDYLGYGVTLGTWYLAGELPLEVVSMTDEPEGLEVDEHSITLVRYRNGLSKFETRWGTFTDPWTFQPQPKCGFVIVGTGGTLSSYDFEKTVRIQTRKKPEGEDIPVDQLEAPKRNPVEYLLHCMETGEPIEGPLDPAVSRIGQMLVDAAFKSASTKRPVVLREERV
ncbi:MAG TPA: Gfo/Idh/MocA family oxidoreductase, partial [Spirochaetia bacterium]|nr:Gfo/Idh/MocA family oxidoreductase [Spirochaetia bacterium]